MFQTRYPRRKDTTLSYKSRAISISYTRISYTGKPPPSLSRPTIYPPANATTTAASLFPVPAPKPEAAFPKQRLRLQPCVARAAGRGNIRRSLRAPGLIRPEYLSLSATADFEVTGVGYGIPSTSVLGRLGTKQVLEKRRGTPRSSNQVHVAATLAGNRS